MEPVLCSSRRKLAVALTALAFGLPAFTAFPAVAQTGSPVIDDAKLGLVARSSYFDRRSAGDDSGAGSGRQQAWGLGGWLYGNTGEISQMLSFGAAYNFVVPLYRPSDTPYNYILRDPGQDPVSVLGELNAKLRYGDHALVLGRQSINQAWYMEDVVRFYNKLDQSMIGRRDVRAMHPIQYEAATVQGRLAESTVRYYGGYVKNARQINDNEFRNLYSAAYETTCWAPCSKQGDSDGAGYAGLQWKPNRDMMLEGSYYEFQDMLSMVYVDSDYVYRMADKNYLRFGVQYMRQSGNGANRVTGGRDFTTDYVGVYGEVRMLPWLIPYAMAGKAAMDEDIRSPYSVGPSYLVQRIGENSKAGERTWIFGTIFDFGTMGVQGLQFDVNYGQRRNRHTVSAAGATKINDWDELTTDLVYIVPHEGFLKNLRARARYAKVWENGGSLVGEKRTDDLRFDLNLNIPLN